MAPDKFKGSATAAIVADHLAAGLLDSLPEADVVRVPVADGGEGTVAAALAAGFAPRTVVVTGPLGDPVEATFALGDGRALGAPAVPTAVVELATASGLAVLPLGADGRGRQDALRASSRGTGELVQAALDAGAGVVVLGAGGSACTDGGTGLLAALGARFSDASGRPLPDGGGALAQLAAIDLRGLNPRLARTRVVLASDVDNPLLGPSGAAAVFGPQKGATDAQVRLLEAGLVRWRDVLAVSDPTARELAEAPGAGSAGGVGYAALAVLGAELRSGIDLVLDLTGLDALVAGADLVVTGEGSLDRQTLGGKAPVGIARLARQHEVPVVVVCGQSLLTATEALAAGFDAVFALVAEEPDVTRCIAEPGPVLRRVGRQIGEQIDLTRARTALRP